MNKKPLQAECLQGFCFFVWRLPRCKGRSFFLFTSLQRVEFFFDEKDPEGLSSFWYKKDSPKHVAYKGRRILFF
ncbi:hypothetical protein GFS24_00370 [Chitinophaga sp. SYP-B3965]|nr:hypothetical protein [Chitinophaga sp. SYP-B3965]